MNLHGSENFRIISSRSQLKSDWSIHNAGINRLSFNHLKDDKVMQFYMISVSFFHVFIVTN